MKAPNGICLFGAFPFFSIFGVLLFAGLALLSIIKRKSLSVAQKAIIGIVMVICLLYFVFLLWCIIGFGNAHPIQEPVPMP